MEEFGDCYIRGYHVIKEMWEAAAKVLECIREPHNVQGLYAVTVKKREQSWDIYHKGCQECVRSFCDEGA